MSARLDALLEQHRRIDDVARADAFLQRILDEFPSEPEVLARWGVARAEVDPDEAKSFMLQAAELAADDPYAQVRIGRALHSLGAIDEALACAKRAKHRMPPDFEYNAQWASLVGRIAASKGETDLARTSLQWAFDEEPWYRNHAYDLASFLLRHDGRDAALEVLRNLPDDLDEDDRAHELRAELEREA
jgi:tetratricopeptide (TPR) repeat protein